MRSPPSLLFPCVSLLDLFYSWRMDVTTVLHERTAKVVAVKDGSNLIPVCVLDKSTPNLYVDLFPNKIIIIIIFSSLNWSITVEHVMTTVNVNRPRWLSPGIVGQTRTRGVTSPCYHWHVFNERPRQGRLTLPDVDMPRMLRGYGHLVCNFLSRVFRLCLIRRSRYGER